MSAADLLAAARARLDRLQPHELAAAVAAGARVVDIRPAAQRALHGELPGARLVELTVLPWRLDPASPSRLEEATASDTHWIILCQQGFSSSVAAAGLREAGLVRATDLAGGYEALCALGLAGVVREPGPGN